MGVKWELDGRQKLYLSYNGDANDNVRIRRRRILSDWLGLDVFPLWMSGGICLCR